MNQQHALDSLEQQYEVLDVVDLTACIDQALTQATAWIKQTCERLYRPQYYDQQRIIFTLNGDIYANNQPVGLILRNLQVQLNQVDISNYFVILVSTNPRLEQEILDLAFINKDPVLLTAISVVGPWQARKLDLKDYQSMEPYQYGSADPLKVSLRDLDQKHQNLLSDSKTFCIYPWMHLHVWPTGQAFPCCGTDGDSNQVGSTKTSTLKEIWNSAGMKQLRLNMLDDQPSESCSRCYEQESAGFFSMRRSANKHHGHLVHRVDETQPDGTMSRFEMTYWDIRYSNLCNLSCRSCGHIFSSSWYQDQIKLAGPEYRNKFPALNVAGRWETDIWEQMIEHIDYVEQIYFAGGEPLLMMEHYRILEELVRRKMFHVRLVYNTNFTEVRLKDKWVFDYWRLFDSVSVGASLDAQGARGEYIRKGTDWDKVEHNRRQMMEICPRVDFYVSSTLSIMNAWHLPDFHKDWVEKGLIAAQDFNINILQDPKFYRIDIATPKVKDFLREKYQNHLAWLDPLDRLRRATVGYTSAIRYLDANDNTGLIPEFWRRTEQLDEIRRENILTVIPELEALR